MQSRSSPEPDQSPGQSGTRQKAAAGNTTPRPVFNTVTARLSRICNPQPKREDFDDLVVNPISEELPEKEIDTEASVEITASLADVQTRYETLKVLARGGQGIVSLAQDKQLGRMVALKTLREKLAGNPEEVKHFIAEAKITAQLDHPSIIPLYSINTDSASGLHIAMKLVRGRTLREYLENLICNYQLHGLKPFDESSSLFRRLDLFLRVCDAICYAHHNKVIHCDLKPENIMIGEFSEVFVMDWGIAKPLDQNGQTKACDAHNQISGTPRYLSPETLSGNLLDVRSDLFTLGLILQEIVTLQFAVDGEDADIIMHRIKKGRLNPVRHEFGAERSPDLSAIIQKATALNPEDRYRDVQSLADDLRRFCQGKEVHARPDGFFMKMVRMTHQHRTGMFISLLSLLAACALLVAFAIHQQLLSARTANQRAQIINAASSHCVTIASLVDRLALNIEHLVSSVGAQAAYLFDENEPGAEIVNLLSYRNGVPEKTPEDLRFSAFYRENVSLQYGLYKGAEDTDPGVLSHEVRIMGNLLPAIQRAILHSQPGGNPENLSIALLQQQMLEQGMPMKSMFLGTRNGSYIVYPWRDTYRKPYDPRVRPWFLLAKDSDRPVWGRPYVGADVHAGLSLPCSKRVEGAGGTFYGVIAMDCTFNKIASLIRNAGPLGSLAEEVAITDTEGRCIISSNSPFFGASSEIRDLPVIEPEMPLYGTSLLRQTFLSRKFGSIPVMEQGREKIYSFACLHTLRWYLIVKMDFNTLANQSNTRETAHW